MNLPNGLTILRIVLAILLMPVALHPGFVYKCLALVIFLAASLTDYWDGRLARKNKQVTDFGILMDPVADKMLVLSAFIAFAWIKLVPVWTVSVVIVRDMVVTGRRLFMKPGRAQSARASGKNKTVFQFSFIVGILMLLIVREMTFWNASWNLAADRVIYAVMLGVVAMTLWSGVRYIAASRSK